MRAFWCAPIASPHSCSHSVTHSTVHVTGHARVKLHVFQRKGSLVYDLPPPGLLVLRSRQRGEGSTSIAGSAGAVLCSVPVQGATAPLTQLPAPQHEEPDFMHPGLSVDDVDAVATSTLTPEAAAAQKLAFLKLVAASKELTPDMTVLHLMAAACDPDSKVRRSCSMIN